jgi:hypothetical protein
MEISKLTFAADVEFPRIVRLVCSDSRLSPARSTQLFDFARNPGMEQGNCVVRA